MKKLAWRFLFISTLTSVSAGPSSAEDLIVDLGNKFKPVNHLASCSLYGIKSNTEATIAMIAPTKPSMFVQMAPNGGQLPNGSPVPLGDMLMAAPIAASHGAQVTLRMPDVYPTFPYQWVSMNDWLNKVDQMVSDWLASGNNNLYGYEIWNEPDYTWNTSAAGNFNDAWKITYDRIKSI